MERFRVINEKPNIERLRKEGYTCVDMHFHSKHSDGRDTVSVIAKRAQKFGIGISLTDHNEILGSISLSKNHHLISVPGIEVTSKEGCHMLFYFYSPKDLISFYTREIEHAKVRNSNFIRIEVEDLIEKGKNYNSVTIAAHPYAPTWTGIMNLIREKKVDMKIFDKIDGIEAITGANLRRNNRKSTILALNLGKAITGGTDGHVLYEMGKVVTYAENCENGEQLLEAVKKYKSYVIGKEIDTIRKATSHSMKIPKHINKTAALVKHQIRYTGRYVRNRKNMLKEKIKNKIDKMLGRK